MLGPMKSICHPHQSYQPDVTSKNYVLFSLTKLSLLNEYATPLYEAEVIGGSIVIRTRICLSLFCFSHSAMFLWDQ